MAKGVNEIGAPVNGNIWRIGIPERGALKAGDIVHKGEEIANLEAMKMENVIIAPFDAQISEVCADPLLTNSIEKEHNLSHYIPTLSTLYMGESPYRIHPVPERDSYCHIHCSRHHLVPCKWPASMLNC